MQALDQLMACFQAYVWQHFLSMLIGLMLLKQVKTLTALAGKESVPTLSRTMNFYQWPLEEMRATRRQLIAAALQKHYQRRGGPRPTLYLILDDTVLPKRGKKLPKLGHHFAPSQDRVVRGHNLVFAAVRVGFLHCSLGLALLCEQALLQRRGLPEADRAGCGADTLLPTTLK